MEQRIWVTAAVLLLIAAVTLGSALAGDPQESEVAATDGATPGLSSSTSTSPTNRPTARPTTSFGATEPASAPPSSAPAPPDTTTPFTLAAPATVPGRPTTIPPQLFPGRVTTSTTPPPIPTTTIQPPVPDAPPNDNVCLALKRFFTFVRSIQRPGLSRQELADITAGSLPEITTLLRGVDPATYGPIISILDNLLIQVTSAPDAATIAQIMEALLGPANTDVAVAIGPLVDHASGSCPALSPNQDLGAH